MKQTLCAFAFLFAFSAFAEKIAFVDVNVIPMDSNRIIAKQTVVVDEGRIVSIGPSKTVKPPKGARVIQAKGKYLMPGLAEMHGHIPPPNAGRKAIENTLFLYVANGITTVRGMLGSPGQLELRKDALRGVLVSPTLYLAGPSFNGNSVNSVAEAEAKVKQQKSEGWDLLKVHPGLTRAEYDAMATTARAEKIRFGGHVPEEVGLLHAIEMGQETFDHLDGYAEYLDARKSLDPVKLRDAVTRSKAAGVWVVPTMALWETLMGVADLKTLKSFPELKYWPEDQVEVWTNAHAARVARPAMPIEEAKLLVQNRLLILRALNEGGVRVLMGTDAPQQFSVPGFSLHRELQSMKASGMSNFAILESGTRNVGEYFANSDNFGQVKEGMRADLILIDANPLSDITNIRKISGVMTRGRWLDRKMIDQRLARIAAEVKSQ